jgi:Predicted hydrolase of the alpha/beta superfamily
MILCIFEIANKESGALVVKLGLRDYFMVPVCYICIGMELTEFKVKGRRCVYRADEQPEVLLIETIDARELEGLDAELSAIKAGCKHRFAYVALIVEDWNKELAPWTAAPVFGKVPFGDGARNTVEIIKEGVIPEMLQRFGSLKGADVIIGGYSLAGLFALWCCYESDLFSAVAAASPSVWYPEWMKYIGSHNPNAKRIYLSLGDAEAKTKNPVMATVADNITALYDLLKKCPGVRSLLEWNEGGHFREPDLRTARAFVWAVGW